MEQYFSGPRHVLSLEDETVRSENAQRSVGGRALTAEKQQHPLSWELQVCTHREQPCRFPPTLYRPESIKEEEKNQSLKMLTNSINFGMGMILFLFSFCLYSLNFPFDSL